MHPRQSSFPGQCLGKRKHQIDREVGRKSQSPQKRTAPRIMLGAKGPEKTQFAIVQPYRQFNAHVAAERREQQAKIRLGQNPRGTGLKIDSRDIQR